MKLYAIIFALSVLTLFNTVLFGFVFYDAILRFMVANQKSLKKGHEIRDFYLKLPISLDFKIFFFNVTNPSEVQDEGKIPVLKEIGPYSFDAFKEKVNVEDDEVEDSLSYNAYDTYFFNKTRTGQLSLDDYVTILNPLVVGMINAVSVTQPRFLSILDKALKALFQDEYSIYITVKVREILFEGITINCTVKDFSAKAICSQLKTQAPVIEIEKNIFLFSLLGSRNGTSPTRMKVLRGIKTAEDLGRVIAVNNETDMKTWPEGQCNEFHGTDGWVFPSFLPKEDGIWTVSSDLCRSIKAYYVNDTRLHGVTARIYHASFGDMSTNPDEKCFCPAPDKCLPKGVMDLTKCMKVPILVTLPHFLEAESLWQDVVGLSPDKEKHVNKLIFEPVTGAPMSGSRKIQFNLKLEPMEKIRVMNNVSNLVHPILWIEESVEVEGMLLSKITNPLMLLKFGTGLKYLFLIAALEGIAYGLYKYFKDTKKSKVTAVSANESAASANNSKSAFGKLKFLSNSNQGFSLQTVNGANIGERITQGISTLQHQVDNSSVGHK